MHSNTCSKISYAHRKRSCTKGNSDADNDIGRNLAWNQLFVRLPPSVDPTFWATASVAYLCFFNRMLSSIISQWPRQAKQQATNKTNQTSQTIQTSQTRYCLDTTGESTAVKTWRATNPNHKERLDLVHEFFCAVVVECHQAHRHRFRPVPPSATDRPSRSCAGRAQSVTCPK